MSPEHEKIIHDWIEAAKPLTKLAEAMSCSIKDMLKGRRWTLKN